MRAAWGKSGQEAQHAQRYNRLRAERCPPQKEKSCSEPRNTVGASARMFAVARVVMRAHAGIGTDNVQRRRPYSGCWRNAVWRGYP
jgi:hypothetical protein